jgi:hypothetical protein
MRDVFCTNRDAPHETTAGAAPLHILGKLPVR